MVICAVIHCENRSGRDKKRFFRLPSIISHQGDQAFELSRQRQTEWLARIKRKDIRPDQYNFTRVCGDHFLSGSPSKLFNDSSPDWAPSLKLRYDTHISCVSQSAELRHERAMERQLKKRSISQQDPEHEEPSNTMSNENISEKSEQDEIPVVSVQTDFIMETLKDLEEQAKVLHTPYVNDLEVKLKNEQEKT